MKNKTDKKSLEEILQKNAIYYECSEKNEYNEIRVNDTVSPEILCIIFTKEGVLRGFSKEIIF